MTQGEEAGHDGQSGGGLWLWLRRDLACFARGDTLDRAVSSDGLQDDALASALFAGGALFWSVERKALVAFLGANFTCNLTANPCAF